MAFSLFQPMEAHADQRMEEGDGQLDNKKQWGVSIRKEESKLLLFVNDISL